MSKIVLFILDLLKGVFQSLHIDYSQLRAILEIKLLMDKRRKPAAFANQPSKSDANTKYQYWIAIFMYAILGGLVGSLIFAMPNVYWATTIVFAYIMVMTIMTLITDFASVVMDTTDYAILSPRPVDSRTVWMARLIHVVVYVLTLTFSVALLPIVFVGIKYGLGALLLFVVLVILSALFAVFLTNLLYMLLIRFTSEARLKQIIAYVQIGFTMVFVSGYQILPRLIKVEMLQSISLEVVWWQYLVPPFWMGGIMEAFVSRHFETPYIIFTLLAVTLPVGIIYLMNSAVSKSFSRKLLEMNDASGDKNETGTTEDRSKKPLSERLSAIFTRHPLEKMGFELTWKITSRDQKFKMRTYPTLGVMIPTIFVFLRGQQLGQSDWQYILILYAMSFAINAFYTNIQFSDDYKATWFYGSVPADPPGYILSGALKAVFIKFILPVYAFLIAAIFWFWGVDALANVILALFNNMLFICIFALISPKRFPFSQAPAEAQQASSIGIALLMMMVSTMIGFAHYGLARFPTGIWIAIAIVGGTVFYFLRLYSQTTWSQIRASVID
ncbi:hypothetical protein QNI16_24165 [Cytophagaceae bacterium YF14B1]|uniref:Uncharacterized protein n=1 Tax=Xanthocytophaga flava TaxID=3048013 RepID=A0AAE3U8N3_9BACT|nr:hypothetical protein [Xanthocytophaga flavus]MDJ1483616.1 hypothetical protein [Xanthocytophaga flavus]